MSYFKAKRNYGACYGNLWKQHSAGGEPPNVSAFKQQAGGDKNSIVTLTSALDKNERSKCYEFCVLMGTTMICYENLSSFRKGDHPSVSTQMS